MKRIGRLLGLAVTVLLASTAPVAAADSCDFAASGSIFGGQNFVSVELCPTCVVGPAVGPGGTVTVKIFNQATCSSGVVGSAEAGYLLQTVAVGESNEGVEFTASLNIPPGSSGQVQFTMPPNCDRDLDGVCANRVNVIGLFTSVSQTTPSMAVDVVVTPAP